jgi:hemolysin activation/secretion protein
VWSPREIVRGFDQDPITARASQLAAANAEIRVPVASLLGRPATSQLPLEVFTFADAGRFLAPHHGTLPSAVRDLASVGAGARINAAGFVFELNAVHALTPLDGWRMAVNFRPGF